MRTLKTMLTKKDLIQMKFLKEQLQFENTHTLQNYDIQCKSLAKHDVYLSRDENQLASTYAIKLQWQQLLALLKIAEYIEGKICMAMETVDNQSAVAFLHTGSRDFQCNIGIVGVAFDNLDSVNGITAIAAQPQANMQRLKKVQAPEISNISGLKNEESEQNESVRVKTSPTEKKVVVRQEEEQKHDNEASRPEMQVDEDEGARERRIKKENFYKEVDNEDFF